MTVKQQRLDQKVRDNVRQGRLMPAVVLDVFFDKATVQLSNTGTRMHGLNIIGGPIEAGQSVNVDFTTPIPTVVAKSEQGITASDLESALKKLNLEGISDIPKIMITLFSGGTAKDMYNPTAEGFNQALGDANLGDVIWLPDVDLEGNFEIPEGVSISGISSRQSIIRGQITLNPDCTLENLSVINPAKSADEVNAVITQGDGYPMWIKNCEIHGYNCGSGIANAIKIAADTQLLQVTNSVVVGDAKINAVAHAFSGTGGTCKIFHSRLYSKSEDHYDGTTFYEYSNIGTVTELERACMAAASEMYNVDYSSTDLYITLPKLLLTDREVVTVFDVTAGSLSTKYFAQIGDYLYFDYQVESTGNRVVREYNLAEDTYIDIVAWEYSLSAPSILGLVATGNRQVYTVHNNDNGMIAIYRLTFDSGNSLKVAEFDINQGGDEETGIGVHWLSPWDILPVKDENGDLHVVVQGVWQRYEGEDDEYGDMYTAGPFFIEKNITTNSEWQLIMGNEIIPVETCKYTLLTSVIPSVINGRYVVATADFQVDDIVQPAALGAWALDINTGIVLSDYIFETPNHSTFTPFPHSAYGNNEDGLFYIAYNNDYHITELPNGVVYKFDPATGVITEHVRAADNNFFSFLANREKVLLFIRNGDTEKYTIKNVSTLTTLISNVDHPVLDTGGGYSSPFINDENEMVWYVRNYGVIRLWDVTDNSVTNISGLGIEDFTAGVSCRIRQMLGNYIIFASKFVGPGLTFQYKLYVVKDPEP